MTTQEQRAFDFYCYYLAIRLHFTSENYDLFRYNGKTKASYGSFLTRKDRYFFEKAARIYKSLKFLEKCLVEFVQSQGQGFFIRNILSTENEKQYLLRQGRLENFRSHLSNELGEMVSVGLKKQISSDQLVKLSLRLYTQGIISLETLICLDDHFHVISNDTDPLGEDIRFFMKKYRPFIARYIPSGDELQKIIEKEFVLLG